MTILRLAAVFGATTLTVAACGSDLNLIGGPRADAGGDSQADAGDGGRQDGSFTIGGTVSGLLGTGLVLQNNAGDEIPVAKNGTFTFPKPFAKGASFAVTVKTQPSAPTQTCTVGGGTGTIAEGNVTSVAVSCATDAFTLGGTVTGLAGSGLVLQNNGGTDLIVNANGTFAFAAPLASGSTYGVTVKTQPTNRSQTCAVTNGAGIVTGANVANVAVACTTNKYAVGGVVTGLSGNGLTLQVNGGETVSVPASGTFAFPTAIESGESYEITVSAQPSGPTQTCTVSGGTGTVGAGDVSSTTVNCATNKYTIGGTTTGLLGTAILQNNGGDDLNVTANGSFAFGTSIDSGAAYAVTVKTNPGTPSQQCTLTNESGNVAAANVTGISLTCVTNTFKVKGTVTGLAGSGLVLQNNGGDTLPVADNGSFELPTPVASGQTYAVTVSGHPSGLSQTCSVTNANGTIGASDVTDVVVDCKTNAYTVGGTTGGLVGSGLVLQNALGDDLPVNGGTFTFTTPVLSGGAYAVSVKTQPSSPSQNCVVAAGSGTVTNGNVVTVSVNCSTNTYAVGGTTTGLVGTGLVLQNNLGDDLTVNGNGNFSFGAPIKSGQGYSVSVKTQPTVPSQTCTVTNSAGTVTNGIVSNVAVSCTTNTYSVSGTVTGLGGGSVTLKNNGGDDLVVPANGPFTFVTKVASGAPYNVSVGTYPAGKSCIVTNHSGTMGAANVSNVSVTCVDGWPSCKALKAAWPSAPSGVYPIDVDGAGPKPLYSAYCEMTIDGGGWEVMGYLRNPAHWNWSPSQNVGTVGDTANGFDTGATMSSVNASFTERVIVYLKLIENGNDLGTQWMISHRTDGVPVTYNNVVNPNGWGYRDSYGYADTTAGDVCSHGCETYRGLGMFKYYENNALGWSGTQGGDYGCRDGNNICWMARGLSCNVGGARCAYLTGTGEGVIYAAR